MNDMSSVIVPKSDQINADDFIAGPRTITIREVQIRGGQEQPVSIYFDGSDKAYRPCKSMSRVLVQAWGADASKYIGRSLTLYRDPTVKWAGMEVGGIRISHMTHIDGKLQLQLTATKGQRKPHIVMPLETPAADTAKKPDAAAAWTAGFKTKVAECTDAAAIDALMMERGTKLAELQRRAPDLHAECIAAVDQRRDEVAGDSDSFGDDFTDDTPTWGATIDRLKTEIDGCTERAGYDRIADEFATHRAVLPAEVAADMDQRLRDLARAIERREEG